MNMGSKEMKAILEELETLKLLHMAMELQKQYKQPSFHELGRLELISSVVHTEYTVTMNSHYEARLKKAKLRGSTCSLEQCRDTTERRYQPVDIVSTLGNLNFIREGMDLCIFGASDSGKTYFAKAIDAKACREFRVAYFHCEELVGELPAARKADYMKYKKKFKSIANFDLVIWMTFYYIRQLMTIM